MIKFLDLLTEEKQTYDYGCAMLYFNFPEMNKIHDAINPDDVYTQEGDRSFGFETEPHCTLLYGLHEGVTLEQVTKALKEIQFGLLIAYNASLFKNEKYDVLKFDMRYPVRGGNFLSKANQSLKQFPFTSNFPDYHPHMTIAYLKPGTGERYAKMLKEFEYDLIPQYVVYSKPNGDKDKIKIKVD